MLRKYAIFLGCITVITAQVSMSDINKISNQQLDLIREELKTNSMISTSDIDLLENAQPPIVEIEASKSKIQSDYFGYNYFKKDINFFDNTPTPSDFKLGPGDEIILSLWGETNLRENFVINKDGLIYYENIGFINLSNKTLEESESILTVELSRVYETLKEENNTTKLMLELGKIKSINVYFSGNIESPGINLIHPFSDIFSAIVQAGGITNDGTLREVQLIRNNKLIFNFDFYSFFVMGDNNFSSIRLVDGDVIHIPNFSNRVKISGEINQNGFFEILSNESVENLVKYAGGLTSNAASNAILNQIVPIGERSSDDNAMKTKNISVEEFSNINLNDGDSIKILSIGNVENTVTIFGRVKSTGKYGVSNLKSILDLAGGFDDPIFRKTIRDDSIVIIRKDENQFYGLEFQIPYSESDKFNLSAGDKIFVYENTLYDNLFSISVQGEVNKRGNFQLTKGMTVNDAINLAEGFTELANQNAIIINEVFTSVDSDGNPIEETRQVSDGSLDFELTDGSIVKVLPLENVVNVEGNVYNPGLITYTGRQSIKKYIALAGGLKQDTLIRDIYIQRANGKIQKVTRIRSLILSAKPGDTIVVPANPTPKEDFNITSFVADLATTLANIAAILVIIDNNND